MAQNYRNQQGPGRPEDWRGGRQGRGEHYPTGADRDRFQSGDERRYSPDRDDRSARGGYEGNRWYSAGGYPEEFGYRRDDDPQGNQRWGQGGEEYGSSRFGESQRGASQEYQQRERDYGSRTGEYSQGSQYGQGQAGREQWDSRGGESQRGDFRSQQNRGSYGDFGRMSWEDQDRQDASYYGTGNYAGAYGSAPGSRASGMESYGGGIFGRQGGAGWLPESGRSMGGADESPRSQSSFRGRGPKGYERSDERLKEMICERLTDDPRIDASEVNVEVTQKVVKLTGTVDDRRAKYQVEELIERCGGVKDIDNQLRVQSNRWRGSGESESGSISSGTSSGRSAESRAGGSTGSSSTGSSSTAKRN